MPKSGFMQTLKDDPATQELFKNLGSFAAARAGHVATSLVSKATGGKSGDDDDDDDVSKEDQIKGGAIEGAGEAVGEGKSKIWGGIKGALKGLFKKGGSAKRPTNIYEQVFIGVPVEQAYQNWTEYSNFPEFMKGPESVKVNEEEGEDGKTKVTQQWTAKIFLNRRSWKATVEEDVENSRIRWSTEAAKGTIDGAISFTPIGDNATLMVYTLEYRPKGFFEWWGNRNRVVGRRARLDVKHFARYVMMQDQTADREAEEAETEKPDDEEVSTEEGQGETEPNESVAGSDSETDTSTEAEPESADQTEAEVADSSDADAADTADAESSADPDQEKESARG